MNLESNCASWVKDIKTSVLSCILLVFIGAGWDAQNMLSENIIPDVFRLMSIMLRLPE